MTQLRSVIIATGAYLPEKIVTNADLSKRVDTTDDWIVQRTGIRERRQSADNQATSDLATNACKNALANAKLTPQDIDGIIVATTTPDDTFPATGVHVQRKLGMEHGFAFDVQAVCSGFIYALSVADGLLAKGVAKRVLVVGAEKMGALLDWTDRTTCILFGDGAGAVILEATADTNRGILSTHLHSDGRYRDLLHADGGVSTTGTTGKLRMQGREVYKHAVTDLAQVVDEVLAHHALDPAEIDWLVPHQANIRIIESVAQKLSLSMDRVVLTLDRHGNTSAASVPLALHEAVTDGRIQKGQLILMEAMGGGFTWGAALVRM